MVKDGLAQANTLRSNNISQSGYGIVYADEISGHRTVGTLACLYALHDWQLSASGDNTGNDAIGQLWYVVDADGNGNGELYQLKDWEKRNSAGGWKVFTGGSSGSTGNADHSEYQKTADADAKYATKTALAEGVGACVKSEELGELDSNAVDTLWNEA